jgi:hypothetical protein
MIRDGTHCIDDGNGSGSIFINNIAVAIPATVSSWACFVALYAQWNNSIIGSPTNGQAVDTFANDPVTLRGKPKRSAQLNHRLASAACH